MDERAHTYCEICCDSGPATWERADQASSVKVYSWRWATQDCLTGTSVTPASGYSVPETMLHGFRPLAPVPETLKESTCMYKARWRGGLETGCSWRGAEVPYHVEDWQQAMFLSFSHILNFTNKRIYKKWSSSLQLAQWNVKRLLILYLFIS